MTPAAMHELAALFRDGKATIEERELLQGAIQDDDVETLADLDGQAASAYAALRERAAGTAPASAAPTLVGHTFELYGLDEPPLFLGAFGLDAHHGCDLLTFCRNPLHPGPCKGWKGLLKVVAPGVHKMLEDDRKAKLAKRRAERKGQGKGRDGDGDGKKGEDDSKKPKRKPRAKATPDEPAKDEPYAEPGHTVKLRKETRALVAAAVKSLPKDDEGWKAVVQGDEETFRPIDEMVTNALSKYAQAVVDRNNAQENYAKNLGYDSWTDLTSKNQSLADVLTNGPTGKDLEDKIRRAGNDHDQIKTYRDALDAKIVAKGGDPKAGRFPSEFEHLRRSYGYVTRRTRLEYPKDANGADMIPPELAKHADSVLKAGAAIRADLAAAFADDPQMKAFNEQANTFSNQVFGGDRQQRDVARLELKRVQFERRRRERELVVDALAQFRPMGGSKISNTTGITQRSDLDSLGRDKEKVARRDWKQQLDVASQYLPDAWVDRSNKTPMNVISSDRAFHSAPDDWKEAGSTAGMRASTLAMTSQKGESGVLYDGAFGSYSEEVTLHEFGHRLESQIPGIKALEFAYVRKKATLPNGNLEPVVKLKDIYGGGYKDAEVSYQDKFPDLYTGKTYEGRTGDPANESWEAFQVGLQDTFGRGSRKFGEPDLQDLVLGAMATLGRS